MGFDLFLISLAMADKRVFIAESEMVVGIVVVVVVGDVPITRTQTRTLPVFFATVGEFLTHKKFLLPIVAVLPTFGHTLPAAIDVGFAVYVADVVVFEVVVVVAGSGESSTSRIWRSPGLKMST